MFATILALHAPSLHQIVQRQFAKAGPRAVRTAMCIAGRESMWNPHAVSSDGARGLFQIEPRFHPQFSAVRLFEPGYNAWAAWVISRHGRDWSAWNGGRWPC